MITPTRDSPILTLVVLSRVGMDPGSTTLKKIGGVKADDGSEYCHRDSSNDDGVDPGAQPDNKQRSQSGFRKAVEQYQIRL